MGKRKAVAKSGTRARKAAVTLSPTEEYRHPTAEALLRPDVGTQAQFRKKKPPQDLSLRFVAFARTQLGRQPRP